jgi:predicted amidohydrolase
MARILRVAAAQSGPIQKEESREAVVVRLLELMKEASAIGCDLVVFTELALTTFFPRYFEKDQAQMDSWFESEMPNTTVQPLFDYAIQHGIGFSLGYAEKTPEGRHFNTSILVDSSGAIAGKYRKVHLPGHAEFEPERRWQHLEKRYFEPGDLGFPVWRSMNGIMGMCICNDRRWPETYRVMGLQGVEMVMLGYNTPTENSVGEESQDLRLFHNRLSMQSGAYQNGTWVIGVAKAGVEDGLGLLGGSLIVNPSGEIVAECQTTDDELIVADCDLDACAFIKDTIFNFAAHRRTEHYGLITERTGAEPPA